MFLKKKQKKKPRLGGVLSIKTAEEVDKEQIWAPLQDTRVT